MLRTTAQFPASPKSDAGYEGWSLIDPTSKKLIVDKVDMLLKNKILAFLAAFIGSSGAIAEQTMCPPYKGGIKVQWIGVYDGYIEKMARLEGDDSGWSVVYPGGFSEGYFIKCTYSKNAASANFIVVAIPKSSTHCQTALVDQIDNIVCN